MKNQTSGGKVEQAGSRFYTPPMEEVRDDVPSNFDVIKPRKCFACEKVLPDVYPFEVGNKNGRFSGESEVYLCPVDAEIFYDSEDLHARKPSYQIKFKE